MPVNDAGQRSPPTDEIKGKMSLFSPRLSTHFCSAIFSAEQQVGEFWSSESVIMNKPLSAHAVVIIDP